jgi:hypothetical protein
MPPTHKPAPRTLRLKSDAVSTSLPPAATALVDSLVGTFYGTTRAEVLRFIVQSWLTTNIAAVSAVGKRHGTAGL